MTKRNNQIKEAIYWNNKAFHQKESELENKIDESNKQYTYLVQSHQYIQQHLEKQLSTNKILKNKPGSFNLPNPVYVNGKRKEVNSNHDKVKEEP